ncbi:hypothetical protein Ahy_B06g083928 [Arachis hypogaea]|uniref:Uncharacterized protein n=2 Tax=Arachis TaxID=3817 RepID=A0A444YQY2_ARAHY|nr:hypothetical protein Ahy_B06g083928 [Arachis hypogaea]
MKVYFLEEQNSMYGPLIVDSQSSRFHWGWLNGLAKQKQLEPIKCKSASPVVQGETWLSILWLASCSVRRHIVSIRLLSVSSPRGWSSSPSLEPQMDGDADVSLFFLTRRKNELEFGIEPEDLGGGHTDIVGPYEEWRSTYEAIKAEKVLRMEFSSPEEARKFYNDYSRVKGFATRQGKKIKNISGKIVRYTFVCNREGFRHKKWLEKSDRKCGCLAEMKIKKKNKNMWYVSRFIEEHNHELLLSKFVEYLRSHRKISDFEKAQLNSMREIGISIPKIYESFATQAGGFNMVSFTKQDMYNVLRRLRAMQNGDVNATFRYLEGIAQRCIDFLRDNEAELDFRSCYGTPVLQTEFVELEKSAALKFTREIFFRVRESLKRSVRININGCNHTSNGDVFLVEKYRKSGLNWQVLYDGQGQKFGCSCMRMESFGLPCIHILAVVVRLNLCAILDSLVLKRWSKIAKSEADHWSIVNEAVNKDILYKRKVVAFLHLCTRLVKFSCFDEHDFRVYAERIVRDTSMLESKYGVARESSGASHVWGEFSRINDPVRVRTKGTGHANMSSTMTGKKRRKCSNCGRLGHRRTRCTNAPASSAMDNRNGAVNGSETGKDGADTTGHVKLSTTTDGLSKSFV